MAGGYFCVPRGWRQDPVFRDEPATEREAWIWLLEEAAWAPHEKRVGAVIVALNRGQVAASTRFLASAWGWTDSRVRRFLDRLKNRRMIDAVSDAGVTVITVCDYDRIQNDSGSTDAASDAEPTQQRRSADANKKQGKQGNRESPHTPRRRGEDPDHARWRLRIGRYEDVPESWLPQWGPDPDDIGCQAPDDLIADYLERQRKRSPQRKLWDAARELNRRRRIASGDDDGPADDMLGPVIDSTPVSATVHPLPPKPEAPPTATPLPRRRMTR